MNIIAFRARSSGKDDGRFSEKNNADKNRTLSKICNRGNGIRLQLDLIDIINSCIIFLDEECPFLIGGYAERDVMSFLPNAPVLGVGGSYAKQKNEGEKKEPDTSLFHIATELN
jgi:hypothetical protein